MIKLDYWLTQNDMTATDLQKVTGLNINTIVNIKNGKIKNPNTKTKGKLAKGLGIKVTELSEG